MGRRTLIAEERRAGDRDLATRGEEVATEEEEDIEEALEGTGGPMTGTLETESTEDDEKKGECDLVAALETLRMSGSVPTRVPVVRFRGGGGPGRPGGRGYADEYGGPEEGFDGPDDMSRCWDNGGRGRPTRGGGPPRGAGAHLLVTCDVSVFIASWALIVETPVLCFLSGHDGYRDGQQMHDGSSPVGRERSSSLQGMDMASLPPRKRPWQDGPGTGDLREHESAGADGGGASFCCYGNRLQTLLT